MFTGYFGDQCVHRGVGDRSSGLPERCQRRVGERHEGGIVEADDGHVFRNPQSAGLHGADSPERHHIGGTHNCCVPGVQKLIGGTLSPLHREHAGGQMGICVNDAQVFGER